MKIYKQKDECHYETAIYDKGLPIVIGYGVTEETADTEALWQLKALMEK